MSWIKIRTNLATDPAVAAIGMRLKMHPRQVVGCLVALWCWADPLTADGWVPHATAKLVDDVAGKRGFADAMALVEWLGIEAGGVRFPRWDRHNGQSAKARAGEAERKRMQRADVIALPSPDISVRKVSGVLSGHSSGPEERRGDNTPPTPKPGGGEKDDFRPRLTLPSVLAASPAFIAFWWEKWFPYLLERKGGRNPTISTLEAHLIRCAHLGPVRAIAGMKSAIEKEWAAPDEDAKVVANAGGGRPWDNAPDDWKAWWRDTYPPEDYPDAPRYDNGEWAEVTADHRKHIWEGLQKQQHRRSA